MREHIHADAHDEHTHQPAWNEPSRDADGTGVADVASGLRRFRKKPVVIEAVQFEAGMAFPGWLSDAQTAGTLRTYPRERRGALYVTIATLEGVMKADEGDWIIRGVKGELYPCKPDIFEATYEPA